MTEKEKLDLLKQYMSSGGVKKRIKNMYRRMVLRTARFVEKILKKIL